MSNVPIAGQPSLSPKAIGVRPSVCILVHRALSSSHVVGDVVLLVREDALAIEDGPRVVVDRDRVDLLVVADDRLGKALAEVVLDLGPHVVDRDVEALVGEELHAEPGEPRIGRVRRGAEVVRDLVLEAAVVDGVDLGRDTGRGRERGVDVGDALLRARIRAVAADGQVPDGGAAAAWQPPRRWPAAPDDAVELQAAMIAGMEMRPAAPAMPLRTVRRETSTRVGSAMRVLLLRCCPTKSDRISRIVPTRNGDVKDLQSFLATFVGTR